ncbi:MAG: radical SAM protein [Phascolarctobacterium sp.]|nr:radical SAM protein [Phascolarctobacterium sp.]
MSIIPIFIPHAGCPHQCVFCNQRTISGQQTAAIEGAKAQINKWLKILNPRIKHEAAFYGGSFTGLDLSLQKELLALTDNLQEQGVITSVRLSTRPDYIDEERLQLLAEHHVRTIELGVQSLDDKVLAKAERGHRSACVYEAAKLIKEYGFRLGLQLMVGMPLQDFASVKDTTEQALSMKPDLARIYPLLVIKNTPLEKSYTSGEFLPLTINEAVEQAAYLYKKLTDANVQVIRIGLQADEELCEPGNIIAGPWHPSMGELVKARVLRNELESKLEVFASQGAKKVVLCYSPRLESQLRGQKNSNLLYLQKKFQNLYLELRKVKFQETAGRVKVFVE